MCASYPLFDRSFCRDTEPRRTTKEHREETLLGLILLYLMLKHAMLIAFSSIHLNLTTKTNCFTFRLHLINMLEWNGTKHNKTSFQCLVHFNIKNISVLPKGGTRDRMVWNICSISYCPHTKCYIREKKTSSYDAGPLEYPIWIQRTWARSRIEKTLLTYHAYIWQLNDIFKNDKCKRNG